MKEAAQSLSRSVLSFLQVAAVIVAVCLLGGFLSALGVSGPVVVAVLLVLLLIFCAGASRMDLSDTNARSGVLPAAETLSAFGLFAIVGGVFATFPEGALGITGLALGFCFCSALYHPGSQLPASRSIPDSMSMHCRSEAVRYLLLAVTAVVATLLVAAQLAAAGWVGAQVLGVTPVVTVLIAALAILLLMMPSGSGVGGRRMLALFAITGLSIATIYLLAAATGIVVPHVAYGGLLREVRVLESLLAVDVSARIGSAMAGRTEFVEAFSLGCGVCVMLFLAADGRGTGSVAVRDRAVRRGIVIFVLVATALPALGVLAKSELLRFFVEARGESGAALVLPGVGEAGVPLSVDTAVALDPEAVPMALLALTGAPVWLAGLLALSVMALLTVAGAGALRTLAAGMTSRATEDQAVNQTRLIALGITIAAICIVLTTDARVLTLGALAYSLAGASLFAPLFLVSSSARTTGTGASAGMVGGAAALIAYTIMTGSVGLDLLTGCGIGLVVSLVLTVLLSLVTKPPKRTAITSPEAPE